MYRYDCRPLGYGDENYILTKMKFRSEFIAGKGPRYIHTMMISSGVIIKLAQRKSRWSIGLGLTECRKVIPSAAWIHWNQNNNNNNNHHKKLFPLGLSFTSTGRFSFQVSIIINSIWIYYIWLSLILSSPTYIKQTKHLNSFNKQHWL